VDPDLRGSEILTARQFLDRADVHAVGDHMCGEGVAKSVAARVFLDPQLADGRVRRLLQKRRIEMVTPPGAAARVDGGPLGRIVVLPTPLAIRLRKSLTSLAPISSGCRF